MSNKLNELKSLIKKFKTTQSKWAKTGASDTEPDGVFQVLLVRAFKGKKPEVPRTVDGWELYSKTPGNGLAATLLARTAEVCVKCIESATLAEASAIENFLRDYCWRVTW